MSEAAGQAVQYGQLGLRAASGDPTAIAQLGVVAAKGQIEFYKAIFTKNGVAPSFFETFKFLNFLDNSTGQWKSRFAKMAAWNADQRLSWYIDRLISNPQDQDAIQYYELYGNHPERRIDDRQQVAYEMALAFNTIMLNVLFKNDPNAGIGRWQHRYNDLKIELTQTRDYQQQVAKLNAEMEAERLAKLAAEKPANAPLLSVNKASTSKWLMIGLLVTVLLGLIFYKPKA